MRTGPSRSGDRVGLISPADSQLPTLPVLRGTAHYGTHAAERGSLVSGPFTAAPKAFVTPVDVDDVHALVEWANAEGVPLVPRGGGTGMPGGNLGPAVIVELADAFGGIEWLDRGQGRLRVGAGTLGADVADAARGENAFLPFLPSSGPWCRVGGMVANNAAGARSFRYGAIAPWIDALEGVLASGEAFRVEAEVPPPPVFQSLHRQLIGRHPECGHGHPPSGWPRVRKNSSGYPLDRYLDRGNPVQLLVGSEGTLGIVTHAELRLPPIPAATGLVVVGVDSPEALSDVATAAREIGASTCEFLGRRLIAMAGLKEDPLVGTLAADAYAIVLLEVEGADPAEVDAVLSRTAELAATRDRIVQTSDGATSAALWQLRHAASPTIAREADRGRISTQFIEDCVVPPSALAVYLRGLDEILEATGFDAVIFGHAGDANVHVNPLVDVTSADWKVRVRAALDEVAALVARLGGTLAGEHGDGRLRAPLLARVWPERLVASFALVKRTLDPRGVLNPGVILPLPGQDPLEGLVPRRRAHPS